MQAASNFNSHVGVGTGFGIAGIPGYNQVFNQQVLFPSCFNLVECLGLYIRVHSASVAMSAPTLARGVLA